MNSFMKYRLKYINVILIIAGMGDVQEPVRMSNFCCRPVYLSIKHNAYAYLYSLRADSPWKWNLNYVSTVSDAGFHKPFMSDKCHNK